MAMDTDGNVYVGGGTDSTNFPTRLAFQRHSGGYDKNVCGYDGEQCTSGRRVRGRTGSRWQAPVLLVPRRTQRG